MPPPPPTTESLASAHPSLHAARRPIHLVHACVRQWAHPIAASGLSPHPTSLSADQSEAPLALLHVFQTPFSACHTETACSARPPNHAGGNTEHCLRHLQAIHCKPSLQSVPPPPTMEHRLPWPLFTCAAPRLPHTLPSLLLQLQPKYQHPAPRRRTNFLRFNNPHSRDSTQRSTSLATRREHRTLSPPRVAFKPSSCKPRADATKPRRSEGAICPRASGQLC